MKPEHQLLPAQRERRQPLRPRCAALPCEARLPHEEGDDLRGVHAERLDTVGLEVDVVGEPRRLLGGVGVAVGVHQQPEVERRRAISLGGAGQLGQDGRR